MHVVQADHRDEPFRIIAPRVTDSEGNPVASQLTFQITSDNTDAVSISMDEADPLAGILHFGRSGPDGETLIANINVVARIGDRVIGSFGEQFTVVPGDPTQVVGGGISIPGLDEPTPDPNANDTEELSAGTVSEPPAEDVPLPAVDISTDVPTT